MLIWTIGVFLDFGIRLEESWEEKSNEETEKRRSY